MKGLSDEQKIKFSSIMFQNADENPYALADLNEQDRKKLQAVYAQKIACETVNEPAEPPEEEKTSSNGNQKGGILETVCCCMYPESQRDKFDITNMIFIKRICGTFLLCKKDWLEIGGGEPELYGWLWMNVTYIVALSVTANLNEYFILPQTYKFKTDFLVKSLGIVLIFSIALPLVYQTVIKCLGGHFNMMQSFSLYGYSLFLATIPTAFCFIPSLFWHVGMLGAAGFLKGIFLFRNYSAKIDARGFVLLGVIMAFQALIFLINIQALYQAVAGSSLGEGTKKVFGHHDFIHLRSFDQF